jgi:hypothetical protein
LIDSSTKEKQNDAKIQELEESIRDSNVKELLLRTKIANARTASTANDDASETSSIAPPNHLEMMNNEPQIISFATAYLVIHPKGADFEPLFAYVQQFVPSTNESELRDVLIKNEKLFISNLNDDESKWFYNGFIKMP